MAIQTGGKGRMMSEINVTPFVDVMLVLLIIFMVAAPMMTQGIDVDLPEVNAPPVDVEQEPVIVSINLDGQVFVLDQEIGIEHLQTKLANMAATRREAGKGDMAILLRADQNVSYGLVMKAMGAINAAGITNIGMATDPEPPQLKE